MRPRYIDAARRVYTDRPKSLKSYVSSLQTCPYCLLPIPYSLKNRTFAFLKNNKRQ